MTQLKRILMAEDDPRDVELTLNALGRYALANEVEVVHDGADALDYLFCRGAFAARPPGHPVVVLLDIKMPKVDGIEVLRQMKVAPDLRFVPVVTQFQLALDMALSTATPAGYGHSYYAQDYIEPWVEITAPENWTAADTARLKAHCDNGFQVGCSNR